MSDVVEFIRARLDEDEVAWQMVASRDEVQTLRGEPLAPRMLAQVAAMRRMLDLRDSWDRQAETAPAEFRHVFEAQVIAADAIIRGYAAIWSSHPDYDPSWAPDA